MKWNQSRPGFELVSPCPFPTTITITARAPEIYLYKRLDFHRWLCLSFPSFSTQESLGWKTIVRFYRSVQNAKELKETLNILGSYRRIELPAEPQPLHIPLMQFNRTTLECYTYIDAHSDLLVCTVGNGRYTGWSQTCIYTLPEKLFIHTISEDVFSGGGGGQVKCGDILVISAVNKNNWLQTNEFKESQSKYPEPEKCYSRESVAHWDIILLWSDRLK